MAKFTKASMKPKGNMVDKFRAKAGRNTDALLANTGVKGAGKKMLKGMTKKK